MATHRIPYSLTGEIDGMTVADMIEMLKGYPANARINIREQANYGRGGYVSDTSLHMDIEYEDDKE